MFPCAQTTDRPRIKNQTVRQTHHPLTIMNSIKRSLESATFKGLELPKRSKGGVKCIWFTSNDLAVKKFHMQINPNLLTLQGPCKLVKKDERHGKALMPHQTFACSGRSCHPECNCTTTLNEVPQEMVEEPNHEHMSWIMWFKNQDRR